MSEMDFEDLKRSIKVSLVSTWSNAVSKYLDQSINEGLVLEVLGNTLITRCIKSNVDKENFLKKMSLAWDHHQKGDKE